MSERKNTQSDRMGGSGPEAGPSASDLQAHLDDKSVHARQNGVARRAVPDNATLVVPEQHQLLMFQDYSLGIGAGLDIEVDAFLEILI